MNEEPIRQYTQTVLELDRRISSVVNDFLTSPIGVLATSPVSDLELLVATIREIYWEIHCYQPLTTKAGFAMIGAIPPEHRKTMRALLLHKWEEVEHRVWALDGYLALGGSPSRVGSESEHTSPGAFAVAAVWDFLAKHSPPLSYLGAEYLFEDLTARLAQIVSKSLSGHEIPGGGLRFIVDHATEDEKHSRLLKKLISDLETQDTAIGKHILSAYDCFQQVYPMPLWLGSYERARVSVRAAVATGKP